MINLQETTLFLLGTKLCPNFDSFDYVKWAMQLLENGYDSENLRILAGLDHSDSEVRQRYFLKSFEELNIEISSNKDDLLWDFARLLATKVIEQSLLPEKGLNIMVDLASVSDYSSRFMPFLDLEEDIDYLINYGSPLFNSELRKDNINETIINEFQLFLEKI
jgi:hypothetical protein